jgi:hypothetical protein
VISESASVADAAVAMAAARVRTALNALSQSGSTRLLVRSKPSQAPEGVLTDFDLAVAAGQ